jgi:ankyrin repeat protein
MVLLLQTPVHLASLQGHVDCLDYLVNECSGDLSKRDKNGLNALDLSMKKNMISTEWFIRRKTSKGIIDLLNALGSQRLKTSR